MPVLTGFIGKAEYFHHYCVIQGTALPFELNDTGSSHDPSRAKCEERNIMFDRSAVGLMSPETFATLGENRLAYITAVRSEDVALLCAEAPLLAPGYRVFVLYGADGTPLLLADSREAAVADATSREIETVSVH